MSPRLSRDRPAPRRGLSRDEAAMYIGIGTSLFDAMVADGRMPRPKLINTRKVWDIRSLDAAFDELPGEAENTAPAGKRQGGWDDFRASEAY